MESFNEFYNILLTEATDTSTDFEGVIVDCWNLGSSNEKTFKAKILLLPNVKRFNRAVLKSSSGKMWSAVYPYLRSNKTRDPKASEELKDAYWRFAKLLRQKIKVSGKAGWAGKSQPAVSDFWQNGRPKGNKNPSTGTGKKVDTSKADILIGKDKVSVKGPKAMLMSGEQKEARATVIAAVSQTGANKYWKKKLLDEVDKFVTSTRTIGAEYTAGALRKADPSKLEKDDEELVKQGKITSVKEGNAAARKVLDEQDRLKKSIVNTFTTSFNNESVRNSVAWESMTGWEKFGGKTFNDAQGGQDGEANGMLVWDYNMTNLVYHTITPTSRYVKSVAKQMRMTADLKSGSYKAQGKKAGYSFYQTVRLSVDTVFKKQDALTEAYHDAVHQQHQLLAEGTISEAKLSAVLKKMWDWFRTKINAIWDWLMVEISKLKKYVSELIQDGIEDVMNYFEIDFSVRMNTNVRLA